MSTKPKEITENDKAIIDGWYKRARDIQPDEVGEFVRHLCEDYRHDYWTVVHACAAAAVASAWAVSHGNSGGGITGFQAGCVFWSFYQKWMSEDGPVRLLKFENLLYPQFDGQHQELPLETWEWLREKAKKLVVDRGNAHPDVLERWKSIAEGIVPPGWRLEDR